MLLLSYSVLLCSCCPIVCCGCCPIVCCCCCPIVCCLLLESYPRSRNGCRPLFPTNTEGGWAESMRAYKGKDSSTEAFDESLWLNFIVRSFSRLGAFCTKSALLIVGGNLIPFGYLDILFLSGQPANFFHFSTKVFFSWELCALRFLAVNLASTKLGWHLLSVFNLPISLCIGIRQPANAAFHFLIVLLLHFFRSKKWSRAFTKSEKSNRDIALHRK